MHARVNGRHVFVRHLGQRRTCAVCYCSRGGMRVLHVTCKTRVPLRAEAVVPEAPVVGQVQVARATPLGKEALLMTMATLTVT